jgi:hypothetical protein
MKLVRWIKMCLNETYGKIHIGKHLSDNLKVGCLHPVACTRSGSGFPSNETLV